MALTGKWDINTDNRSYLLYYNEVYNAIEFAISSLGTDATKILVRSGEITEEGAWYFIVGRFRPSKELAVFVNNEKTIMDVSVHASIYSGTASFIVGAKDEGTGTLLHGGCSLNFLAATALPDGVIRGLYQHTRAMFGR